MKVAINAVSSATSPGGQTYLRSLLPWLTRLDSSIRLVLFAAPEEAAKFESIVPGVDVRAVSSFNLSLRQRAWWDQWGILKICRKESFDLLFSPGNSGAFLCHLFRVPTVITIQLDLSGLARLGFYSPFSKILRSLHMYLSVLTSHKTIAVSDSLRNSLVDSLKCPPNKVVTVHHGGAADDFRPIRDPSQLRKARSYVGAERFIIAVSKINHYKNFANLVRAFGYLVGHGAYSGSLCIVGDIVEARAADEIRHAANELGIARLVRILPSVDQTFLAAIYSAADLYVNPSLIETFGLTQVEAMACGTPVAASNCSAMPEVCGNAAMYFDPLDYHSIAESMQSVLNDQRLRSQLIERGLLRATDFSWQVAASKTLDIFYSVLCTAAGK